MRKNDIYIVVPAYNEAKYIDKVLRDISKTGYSIVVVDDGSKDKTYSIAKKTNVDILRHKVNLGKGAAMKTGAEAAFKMGADAIIFVDADGQHDVGDISKFVDKLDKKFDIVYGSRRWSKSTPPERLVGNKVVFFLVKILFGMNIADILCGYRAMTKKAYSKVRWESQSYGVETEMIIRTAKENLKYCEVPVAAVYLESYKGMTVSHALQLIFDIIRWRIIL